MTKPNRELQKWQRIFVNRSLNMGYIRAVGFDMDHTIAMYNRDNFEALAFRETLKKMIEAGYPEELDRLVFNPNFIIRGLLVDMDRGNLLKVDGHKYVKTAFHGHSRLSKDLRHRLYNAETYRAREFLSVDSFFALSEVQLFTEIVDYMDKNPKKIDKTYREVYRDLRHHIDLAHADGSIKNEVLRNIEKYIRRDKYLSITLLNLLEAGKNLFLLTNSHWDYTDQIMSFILSDTTEEFRSWRDYFDFVIVGAGKPGFFSGKQPFYEVMPDSGLLRVHQGPLGSGKVYHGGNVRLLQRVTGFRGDEILYVGDHIYGDIIRSKDDVNWRTMLVVEELDTELAKLEELRDQLAQIYEKLALREHQDQQIQKWRSRMRINERLAGRAIASGEAKKAKGLLRDNEKTAAQIESLHQTWEQLDREIKELINARASAIHPQWGELMRVGLERSRFADQVAAYACVYTSRVSNMRFYSPFKRFVASHDSLPHDQ